MGCLRKAWLQVYFLESIEEGRTLNDARKSLVSDPGEWESYLSLTL